MVPSPLMFILLSWHATFAAKLRNERKGPSRPSSTPNTQRSRIEREMDDRALPLLEMEMEMGLGCGICT